MKPEIQAWRDRLACSVRKIDDIFEEALHQARDVLSSAGVDAWLENADRVCRLGRGTELVLIFLDEIPEVVRHSDEQIIPEAAATCALLSEYAAGPAIKPFLATLPAVSRRLGSAGLLRGWLRLVERMAKEAPGGVQALAERAPYLFNQLGMAGVENWIDYGIRVYRDHPHRLPDYFGLQSADAKAMLAKERSGTLFMDYERQLRLFERAFWDRKTDFRPYSEAFDTLRKPCPHLDRLGIHLPDVYEDLGPVTGIDRYRAAIAHMMAHMIWSQPYLADNFSSFQHICIEAFEDARVEHLAMRQYPGLRRLWLSLHPRPEPNACPEGWSCIRHRLAMLSYALLNPEHSYSDESLLEYESKFRARIEEDPYDPSLSTELGVHWLKDNHEHDFRKPRVWFEDTQVSYRDDNRYLWIFLEDVEDANEFHSDHGAADRGRGAAQDGILPPQHYPEWDHAVQSYRPDWVTVFEAIQPSGDACHIDRLLEKHRRLARQLQRIVDLLKPQQRRRVRYQNEGDELDLDVVIRAAIDYRIGSTPDPRIHQSHVKDGRDIAVLLLLDLSESINDVPPSAASTILQLSQEAVSLLATAVETLGDPFAIAGFSSNTRHEVRYTHFKGFEENWGDEPKGRVAAMRAGLSTRMGAALRHAGRYLENRCEERRLLLVLTDGEPHDIDVQDPKYLQDDTRVAVRELDSKGIATYCITLDRTADDYVAGIFGRNNYAIIDRVERLPEKLPRLFLALTR
ncbi:MAG: VWA domain-containing protein [Gammaproteobacteria bacterium]|nr:VWA domain-containing protein [Gammaproteobacteria bacterium]NNJ97582.1 VWA domain-containing protein [Gammaproteobacteria bacterium]